MANIHCQFYGGEIAVASKGWSWLDLVEFKKGNPWRGVGLVSAVALYAAGFLNPARALLIGVTLWSIGAVALRDWRNLTAAKGVAGLIAQGQLTEAEAAAGDPAPGNNLWWRLLGARCANGDWAIARERLARLKPGRNRDYLLAIAWLGCGKPAEALKLCPQTSAKEWRLIKAQAFYAQGEWQKVLRVLRGQQGHNSTEQVWLKGIAYYELGQYRPAAKLLAKTIKQGGPDYGDAARLYNSALVKIK